MKKTFKRILASLMVAVMLLTAAPLSGLAGIELPDLSAIFSTKADAAEVVFPMSSMKITKQQSQATTVKFRASL